MEEKNLSEKLRDICYAVTRPGAIFGNRYIVVDKFVNEEGDKMIVFFDLFNEKVKIDTIKYFCFLTNGMGLQFTKDIINIDYANNERED